MSTPLPPAATPLATAINEYSQVVEGSFVPAPGATSLPMTLTDILAQLPKSVVPALTPSDVAAIEKAESKRLRRAARGPGFAPVTIDDY